MVHNLAEDLWDFPSILHQSPDFGSMGQFQHRVGTPKWFKWLLSGWCWGCDVQRCQLLRLCCTPTAANRQSRLHAWRDIWRNRKPPQCLLQGNQELQDRVDLSKNAFQPNWGLSHGLLLQQGWALGELWHPQWSWRLGLGRHQRRSILNPHPLNVNITI